MIKPHALREALDVAVADILNGGATSERLCDDDPLKAYIGRINTAPTIDHDLSAVDSGLDLLGVFYGDKQTRRYFPLILKQYLGKVAFMPYIFRGEADELPDLYDAIKGEAETFDYGGDSVTRPRGVRGLLCPPHLAVDSSALSLDDFAYSERCLPMVDNVLHVCDTLEQNEHTLKYLGVTDAVLL